MNPSVGLAGRWWIFPLLLGVSLGVHVLVLRLVAPTRVALETTAEVVEVTMIEEVPPTPEPISDPEPTPEATPEPTPPPPEILTAEEPQAEPLPLPTPVPTPEVRPTPRATPPPAVRPAASPARDKPTASSASAPTGRMVEARADTAYNPPPRYPEFARRNGWEGSVMVRAKVSATGRVLSVSVARPSRYAVLDQAAVQAVKGWKFRPRTIGGIAVEATIEVPVNFSLRR